MPLTETNSRADAEDEGEALFVGRLAAHEEEAWRTAYRLYFPSVYRIAYLRTLRHSAAEDIAAKVFLEAVASIGRYRYRGVPFRSWLYRIASNETADFVKSERRKPQVYIDDSVELSAEAIASSDMEIKTDLLQAMEHLTEMQRNVVVLRFIVGCTLTEVAQILGKSIGATKQLQARAVAVLQDVLRVDERGTL